MKPLRYASLVSVVIALFGVGAVGGSADVPESSGQTTGRTSETVYTSRVDQGGEGSRSHALVIPSRREKSEGRNGESANPYAGFPLHKDVSGSRPFATLDEGQLPNETRWGAYASRVGAGRRGYEQPCLSLARITRFGEYTDVHGCGPLVPTKDQSVPNYVYIAATYQTKLDGPFIGETVLALSFGPAVRSVVLEYQGGGQLHRRTLLFNSKQQRKTKLAPFRYVALAMQADKCASTVIGYSREGSELFSAETVLCSEIFSRS